MQRFARSIFILGFLELAVVPLIITWPIPVASAAAPEAKPRLVVLATHRVGTGFHADGTGIAKLISERASITMVVRPHPGPPAWLPAINKGEIEFGLLTGTDAAGAYGGMASYREAFPNIRVVVIGAPLYVGFWAAANSNLRSVADLRGKRVPSGWTGLPNVHFGTSANLATAGLTWDDVVKVPITELSENFRTFMEGRADVFWHSVGAPAVQEANVRARGGVRLLAMGTEPEGLKRMAKIDPGTYVSRIKRGFATGVLEDTPVQSNDMYMIAWSQLDEEVAYAVAKALWDYNEELTKISARLRPWTRDGIVSTKAAVPYHPGAIKFYREKGVWSADMEKLQQQLLKR